MGEIWNLAMRNYSPLLTIWYTELEAKQAVGKYCKNMQLIDIYEPLWFCGLLCFDQKSLKGLQMS